MTHPKGETREWPPRVMLNASAFANFSGAMAYKVGVADEGKTEYLSLAEHDALMDKKDLEIERLNNIAGCAIDRNELKDAEIKRLKKEVQREFDHAVYVLSERDKKMSEARAKAFEDAGLQILGQFGAGSPAARLMTELAAKERKA